MENKGKVVSRDAIMAALWATDCFVDENTLAVNIARLRKSLKMQGFRTLLPQKGLISGGMKPSSGRRGERETLEMQGWGL